MNRLLCFLLLALASLTPLSSEPLDKTRIAADAKWLLHLDVDLLRAGEMGRYLIDELLADQTAEAQADLKRDLDIEIDWKQVHSITLYGTEAQPEKDANGLLIIHTTLDVKSALNAAAKKVNPLWSVEVIETGPSPLYGINRQAYLRLLPDHRVLVGKTQQAVDRGLAVLNHQRPNLAESNALAGYPDAPFGFFLMATGEGFAEQTAMPPSAAILKQAEGARLLVGEETGRVRLDLCIKTAGPEVAQKIWQVGQGLLALTALNAGQNPDLQQWLNGARVTTDDNKVSLGLSVPIANVVKKISEQKP